MDIPPGGSKITARQRRATSSAVKDGRSLSRLPGGARLAQPLADGAGHEKAPGKAEGLESAFLYPATASGQRPRYGTRRVERCSGVASALLGGGIGAARGPCTRAALGGGAHPPGGQDGGGCAAWYPACMATTRMQNAQPDMWQEVTAQKRSRPVSDTTILPLFNVAFYRQFFYRTLMKMTQTELGEKLGVSKQVISDMEHERRSISKAMAKELAKIFNVSVDRFI